MGCPTVRYCACTLHRPLRSNIVTLLSDESSDSLGPKRLVLNGPRLEADYGGPRFVVHDCERNVW